MEGRGRVGVREHLCVCDQALVIAEQYLVSVSVYVQCGAVCVWVWYGGERLRLRDVPRGERGHRAA